jgi:hypothetical protein
MIVFGTWWLLPVLVTMQLELQQPPTAFARLLHTLRAQRRVTFFDHQAIAFLCRTDKEKAKAAIQQEQVRSAAFHVCNVAFCHARHRQWIWKPPYPVLYR